MTQCLFLRVSSRETPIKSDINLGNLGSLRNEFNYNPVIARALANRSAMPPPPSSYGTCSSTSSGDFSVGEPFRSSSLYPYANKSYFSNMTPWGAGYGEDCVDYAIPTCSPYAVVNDAAGHLVSYQPWDARSKQAGVSDTTDTPSPTMPPAPLPVPPGIPPKPSNGSTSKPGPGPVHSAPHGSSTSTNKTANSTPNGVSNPPSGTTSLVYRLATAVESDDYRHASSPLNPGLARSSIEGIDRLLGEPLGRPLLGPSLTSSMASKSTADFVARSAAPSPAPHSRPPSILHSMPTHAGTSYNGHIGQPSSVDRVPSLGSSLGYSAHSSPVDHDAAYSASNSISGGGLFSDQDRDVGLQGSGGGPSPAASYLDSYTYEPGPPKPSSGASGLSTGMSRQKSKKKTVPSESLAQKATATTAAPATTTTMHRVYHPTESPAPPPLSRPSSPPMYTQPHHDARNESLCGGNHGHNLQHIQHTSGYRI